VSLAGSLTEILSDFTLRMVALGAMLLGVTAGAIGCFAVLRRQSLIGDTLSHAALPGICVGFLVSGSRALGPVLLGALAAGALAGLAVMALGRASRLKTDAALGIVLSLFFAAGVVLLTYIQRQGGAAQAGLESFLFGQAAAILPGDLWVMGAITALALGLVAAFWTEIKLVTFDPVYARTLGLPVAAIEAGLTVLVALAVVIGLQMVGVVLMAAMIIAPAVAARQWVSGLGPMVVLAALIGAVSGVTGAMISATGTGLATGPLIVLSACALVLVSLLAAPGRGIIAAWAERRRARSAPAPADILVSMSALAERHGDPSYPVEETMLDAFHGAPAAPALAALEARGEVVPAGHMASEGAHWVLTDDGHAEAERERGGDAGAARQRAEDTP